ncbi:MAG: hypothetical protein A2Z29_06805 [Chloroflexi bacterium RBG_16_56_11]|nr:MAG: hypothetical protein A2Z29_06805 [Chloroflexi bacterium RBG_16_56_11]
MNGQKGMTMVEMLVAIAVTGIIVVFLGTAIYQMTTVTGYGNGRLTALHELQNAAYWVNYDGQQATAASVSGGLLLTASDNSVISYSLVGSELRRTAGGNQMTVARNITSAVFSVNDRLITMSLKSSPQYREDVSQNGTYRVALRPAGGG